MNLRGTSWVYRLGLLKAYQKVFASSIVQEVFCQRLSA